MAIAIRTLWVQDRVHEGPAGNQTPRASKRESTDTMVGESSAYGEAVRAVRAGELDADEAAEQLIERMTDGELLGLLDGDSPRLLLPFIPMLHGRRPFVAGAVSRLGIPDIRFSDGARGVVIGACTAFPVTIARAATWDPRHRKPLKTCNNNSINSAPTTTKNGPTDPCPAPHQPSPTPPAPKLPLPDPAPASTTASAATPSIATAN